jgi:hypothetical protein
VSVCPYSHPDNPMHNVVRWGVRNSALFRRFAIKMDDVFYGSQPGPAAPPSWIPDGGDKTGKNRERGKAAEVGKEGGAGGGGRPESSEANDHIIRR